MALRPRTDREWIERELGRVAETSAFLEAVSPWAPPDITDCRPALARLGVEGSVLQALELHALGVLLDSAGRLHGALSRPTDTFPALDFLVERLYVVPALTARIDRTVDEGGDVLDSASPDLRRIRSRLRGAHTKIVKKLEVFARDLPERYGVADASVTVREGRYVVPIRREGKREVGGIVHDESNTGATLFVEPPMAIALMNELRALEREEAREVHGILTDLTGELRPHQGALTGSHHALVEFDSLGGYARRVCHRHQLAAGIGREGHGVRLLMRAISADEKHPVLCGPAGHQARISVEPL
ncbi:MAG: hypothetical protein IIB28_05935 [Chloroflexi bacterium]|nr:hypothetical protein [Chloroflexota bacterium]